MKSTKKIIGIAAAVLGVIIVCATFIKVYTDNSTGKVEIRLAHNQQDGTEIANSIAQFKTYTEEDESMNMQINLYPSGVLGTEKEEVEMVKAGILDMAKVSSNTLSQFKDEYAIFAIPYLFTSQEHYYKAMEESEAVQELFRSTEDDGYIVIGYYANGSRNFYLKEDVCCDNPSVLDGLKIRAMQSSTSLEMIEAMGGTGVAMASSETYTSLQQGIVDGAENTELALTVDGHQDLVKSYTYTEHQYTPDVYIISTKKWNSLTEEQQDYLVESLTRTNENFKSLYNSMMEDAITEAEEHGVHIYRDIDKTAFIEACRPIAEEFCAKGDSYQKLYDDIQKYAEE